MAKKKDDQQELTLEEIQAKADAGEDLTEEQLAKLKEAEAAADADKKKDKAEEKKAPAKPYLDKQGRVPHGTKSFTMSDLDRKTV